MKVAVGIETKEEIEADENMKALAKTAEPGRWLAFRAIDAIGDTKFALPTDSGITITIGPGTPSTEGSRTTTDKHEFYFFTFGPLRMTKFECGYNQGCTPNDQWRIEFNNEIDATTFQDSQIRIEPASDRLKTSINGKTLVIDGFKKPSTSFKLTLDKSIRDTFGQTLGQEETIDFKVGPMQPWLGLS